jgi:phosphoglycolate phosphatase-like HAD superfamily hydrolase
MSQSLSEYKAFVFDCDGVILNSNKIKTEAFYKVALPYGEKAAERLVSYHVSNGGVSRYKKFAYFLDVIVGKNSEAELLQLLSNYAIYVCSGLLSCDMAEDLEEFRNRTSGARWFIASGGDQAELREIFQKRGINQWFDGGIFGSPDTKEYILERELAGGNITKPALFLGDSKYDYRVAQSSSLDFLFVSDWTEVTEWRSWVEAFDIQHIGAISDLNKSS